MDTNPIALKVRVLAYNPGSFKNSEGATIEYNTALIRFDGVVLKVPSKQDLSLQVDKDVTLAFEVKAAQNNMPKLSIVGIPTV